MRIYGANWHRGNSLKIFLLEGEMKKYFFAFCFALFVVGFIFLWLLYLDYMLFPPKVSNTTEKLSNVVKVKSRLARPARSSTKKTNKPVEQTAGYPWKKLQDRDVMFALVLTGLISFTIGISYFQLYWKKRVPRE